MSERTFPDRGPESEAMPGRADKVGRPGPQQGPSAPPADRSADAAAASVRTLPHDACRDFMEQMPFAVLVARPDYTVDYVNGRFREMFGYDTRDIPDIRSWFEKFVNKPSSQNLVDPFFGARPARMEGAGMHRESVIAVQARQGGRRLCQVHFVVLDDGRLLTTYEDVAERSLLESDMHYAKIDTVGILARGLGLIVNGVVEGLQGLLETSQGQDPALARRIDAIGQEARSGRELLNRILSFSGGKAKEARPVDMNEILRKTSTIFANTRGGITVRRKLEEKLWAVEMDRIHLEKMLIHLYMYLQQKAPESGELLIEADNAVLYAPESTLYRIRPGRYVKVTLAAGAAAPGQAARPRALLLSSLMRDVDPQDGMSITYAQCVVQSHDGVLMMGDEPGSAPLLQILLPASEVRGVRAPSRQDAVDPGGMILLVDDDEILLEVTREILETAGYRVLTATGGRQALELFEAWRDEIDLVMLDMIMPGIGGGETFRELKKLDPGVSVIIISGYSLPDEVRELLAQGCKGFLQKPVLVHEMFRKIRQAIRGDENATGVNP